ncbi:MAG: hypothetical protein J6B10_05695 [Lachnospiraceae bacterium]|nr:hypothetical protein [Lachnospiraceae bacterium]
MKTDVAVLKEDVSGLKTDVAELKEDVSGLKTDVAVLKEDVSGLKTDVAVLKEDVSELKADVAELKVQVYDLNGRVRNIELTLENEVKRNICVIAEGHSILNRKLDDALCCNEEEESYRLRVIRMENRWEKLRQAVCG